VTVPAMAAVALATLPVTALRPPPTRVASRAVATSAPRLASTAVARATSPATARLPLLRVAPQVATAVPASTVSF